MTKLAPVAVDVNGFFEHLTGEGGLRPSDVESVARRVAEVTAAIERRRAAGELPFFALPEDHGLHAEVSRMADELRDSFDRLVVLGIGGSALGTKAVIDAVGADRDGLEIVVLDNVDPATIARALDEDDLERSFFNVISKSGQTAETMAQFLVVRDRLVRRFGEAGYRDRMLATTDEAGGLLRQIVRNDRLRSLPVPAGVGGRFSVLSAVGLLPMAAAGVDISALSAGARAMDARTRRQDAWSNPAALHAALLYLAATTRGANIHVLMPYADGLLRTAEWYGQLWAESLGKKTSLAGETVEVGQTPVRALGATDQHSQVQLYVEGPRDKVVTFLRVAAHSHDIEIPAPAADESELAYLAGHRLGDLLNMEQTATELALAEAGRMTSLVTMAELDESALGQLFHFFEVQTLVAGGLYGVDPLDQPGVEAGKRMTFALAGRPGYQKLARSIEERLRAKRPELVLG